MRGWRVIDPPDRWELVRALLQSPRTREDVEFMGTRSGRRFPFHVWIEAMTYLPEEPLTVIGRLTMVKDQPVLVRPSVEVRLWPDLRRGELILR
jgi:hypothetical protein